MLKNLNWISVCLWNILFAAALFLMADFVYSYRLNKFLSPEFEQQFRVSHPIYHHSLKENFQGAGFWGNTSYEICTDKFAFKFDCKDDPDRSPDFDVAFIGDSFTEAIGMEYQESFVGIFQQKFPELSVANLAVSSYSPTIYLEKVKAYLESGVTFKHVYVFIDISDLKDEAIFYSKDANGIVRHAGDRIVDSKNNGKQHNSSVKWSQKLKLFIGQNFRLFSFAYVQAKNFLFSSPEDISMAKVLEKERREAVFFNPEAQWTHKYSNDGLVGKEERTHFGSGGVEEAIKKTTQIMDELYVYLSQRNILLSVGVYPWPAQLKFDDLGSSRQVEIWKDFCSSRCVSFVNIFPIFQNLKKAHSVERLVEKYFISYDVHFNALGNELIADKLIESHLTVQKGTK